MVTLAGGGRSALIVAGIHANEPTGCLVADLLMHELAENDGLRRSLDMTWRFVSPVDPDGFLLNEGWFARAPTPSAYLRHFFRPALSRQPDYSFALKAGTYEFSASTPENLAFQTALDLGRPSLLCPLHSCDFGGAFFILSRAMPAFEAKLRARSEELRIPVSAIGEPLAELAPLSRGVFEAPRPEKLIREALEHGVTDPGSVWPVGGSSMEYADRFGATSVTVETPVWETRRTLSVRWSLRRILGEYLGQLGRTLPLLEQWTPAVADREPPSELGWAAAEYLASQRRQMAKLRQLREAAPTEPMSAEDTASLRIQLALFGLRAPATLLRLLSEPSHRARSTILDELRSTIGEGLAAIRAIAPLEATPRSRTVALQAVACLEAAQFTRG